MVKHTLLTTLSVLLTACSIGQASSPTASNTLPTPTLVIYGIWVRVEPILVGNLGDRVFGPATIYVDAPGAQRVEVYLQPIDQPVGGRPTGEPRLIASINQPADSYKIPWRVDEPYAYVAIWATAFMQPDVNYSRSSLPMPLILPFQPKKK